MSWDLQMGLKYRRAVGNIITGLCIQCKGWRSVALNPSRKAFLGAAPRHLCSRWCNIRDGRKAISKYSSQNTVPSSMDIRRFPSNFSLDTLSTHYGLQIAWPPSIFVPSLCLLRGISLFPKVRKHFSATENGCYIVRDCLRVFFHLFLSFFPLKTSFVFSIYFKFFF